MRLCSFPKCGRKHYAKGHCKSHYRQTSFKHELSPIRVPGQERSCTVPRCPRSYYAKGLCSTHYHQSRVGGIMRPLEPKKKCSSVGCRRDSRTRGMCHNCFQIVRAGTLVGPEDSCKLVGCSLRATAKGYCHSHYMQMRFGYYNKILGPAERRRMQSKECFDE